MTEYDVLHIAEIDFEFLRVFEDGVRAGARVEKDFVAVGFDQGGESPFADTVIGEHRREDRDFESFELGVRVGSGGAGVVLWPWLRRGRRCHDKEEQKSANYQSQLGFTRHY